MMSFILSAATLGLTATIACGPYLTPPCPETDHYIYSPRLIDDTPRYGWVDGRFVEAPAEIKQLFLEKQAELIYERAFSGEPQIVQEASPEVQQAFMEAATQIIFERQQANPPTQTQQQGVQQSAPPVQQSIHPAQQIQIRNAPPPAAPVPATTVSASPIEVTPVNEIDYGGRHPVDIAICLDTSGSMSGLIESAKQKLWAIVNDLALAEPTPYVRVALLTFGNDGHNPEDGWVVVDAPLTEDLDLVSQRLFSMTTNGGTELVGRVIRQSVTQLDWHPSDDALKLIIVAGNESADQDTEAPFREMCKQAITNGIMVNSIYCGNPADEIAPAWREVAKLADGQFAAIDQNDGTVVIATPFDDQLAELSASVNTTYLPYGSMGQAACANQSLQDANAASLNGSAAASRAWTKSNGLYNCASWDLVDAAKGEDFDLSIIKVEDLPEAMRTMTLEERAKHIEAMATKRTEIQKEIGAINSKREKYIADEMKKAGLDDDDAFDAVIRRAVREQAETKGLNFVESTASGVEEAEVVEVDTETETGTN